MNKSILKKELEKINKKNHQRFHMPGHKGRGEDFDFRAYDITEIPGADNLHDAQGVIREVQRKLAAVYNSEEAAILVNGTTTGIHSAILGACASGDRLLVPVNCHRSVFGALALGRIEGVFINPKIQPDLGFATKIELDRVKKAITENPAIVGMILTNPTYYGTTSDVKAIADLLHDNKKFLIVDEAHGAHLHFNQKLPMDALEAGADVVIQSTHKILGSFTQSSLMHFQGERVNRQRIKSFLALLQSSSPSYPLMISVEAAVDTAAEKGEAVFENIIRAHQKFCRKQEKNAAVRLYDEGESETGYDRSKWLFCTRGISGETVAQLLSEKYGIQCEMSGGNHVLAMTGIGTTAEDLEELTEAIAGINSKIGRAAFHEKTASQAVDRFEEFKGVAPIKTELPLWTAFTSDDKEKKPLENAKGCLIGDYIIPYPPGIPVLLPGSRLTQQMLDYLKQLLDQGRAVVGIDENREILVLKEKEQLMNQKKHKGRLIVIEGVDGSGKQTQTQLLYDRLIKNGEKVMKISYPRYDKESSAMVKLYLAGAFGEDPSQVSPYIASTFYAADRYASYKEDYEEFLNQGGTVLADRYTTSNMVHQAGKIRAADERKKFLDWLWDYEFNLYGLPVPDQVYFLNIPPKINEELIRNRNNKITGKQEKDIHEKSPEHLRESYQSALALVDDYGWTEINCVHQGKLRSIESIHEEIWNDINKKGEKLK
ncbi:aminotransferase class V-fold PLP-dependent enzyme [Acetobacterium fimetarium]|uniref:Thymidylate kinase n=2 Tax=Acetobacterium fimetarium TaxID=52691 RepID=A0ABR6WWG0_9FIRM|nr:aminotransferase class V-fold PLP-dependent enzyme [Acetobacterium fimetarium]MBC3804848.1 aminotransferase class V-fold PLP-dependent enzyme [Acetobacterium fimetarium]